MLISILLLFSQSIDSFSLFQAPKGNSDELLKAYATWHNNTLHSTDIPCSEKQAIVYYSRAGIGDALSGLVGRFASAVQMGRLFLLGDISHLHWSIGLSNPLFDWNFAEALSKGYICNFSSSNAQGYYGLQTSHISQSSSLPKIIIAYGHPTESTSLTRFHSSSSSSFVQWESLIKQFVRPSAQVVHALTPLVDKISFAHQNYGRVLALYIRIGEQERLRFLNAGDERRFAYCAMKWLEHNGQRGSDVIYISSDSFLAKNLVRTALVEAFPQLTVITLEEQGVSAAFPHVSTAFPQSSIETAIGSFADFFMMEYVDVVFRTYRSLFAGTAMELLGKSGLSWHVISSSTCEPNCHLPKFPAFCDEEPLPRRQEL